MTLEEQSLRRHDELSGKWSEKYYGRRFPLTMDEYDIWKRHRLFLECVAKIGPVKRALEIGCGTGDNIAKCNADVRDAVDVSGKMIEEARRRHAGVNFSVADIMAGKLRTGYDLIIGLGVIQYLQDDRKFFDALAGLLANGGHLVLSFPNRNSLFRKIYYARTGAGGRQIDQDRTDVCRALAERGIVPVRMVAHSAAYPGGGRFSAPLWLAAGFMLDGVLRLPGLRPFADGIANSYLGWFRRVE